MGEIDWRVHERAVLGLANRVLSTAAEVPAQAGLVSSPGERCFAQFDEGELVAFVRLVPSILYDRRLRPVEALRVEDLLASALGRGESRLLDLVSEVLRELNSSATPDVSFAYSDDHRRYRSFGFFPVAYEYHLRATGLRRNSVWKIEEPQHAVRRVDGEELMARLDHWPEVAKVGREAGRGQMARVRKMLAVSPPEKYFGLVAGGEEPAQCSLAIGCFDPDPMGREWLRVERIAISTLASASALISSLIGLAGDRGMLVLGVDPRSLVVDLFRPEASLTFSRSPGALVRVVGWEKLLSRIMPDDVLERVVLVDECFAPEHVWDRGSIRLTRNAIRQIVFSDRSWGDLVASGGAICSDAALARDLEAILDVPTAHFPPEGGRRGELGGRVI